MDTTALHKISYGLYILSAREGEKDNGCIINTFSQISSTPLRKKSMNPLQARSATLKLKNFRMICC